MKTKGSWITTTRRRWVSLPRNHSSTWPYHDTNYVNQQGWQSELNIITLLQLWKTGATSFLSPNHNKHCHWLKCGGHICNLSTQEVEVRELLSSWLLQAIYHDTISKIKGWRFRSMVECPHSMHRVIACIAPKNKMPSCYCYQQCK